jgi:acetyl esterase/lipase
MKKQTMTRIIAALGVLGALSACGGNDSSPGPTINTSTERGTLKASPPIQIPIVQPDGSALPRLEPEAFKVSLDAKGVTAITGVPKCAISDYYFEYMTVGAKGEPVSASGAIYVPSGADAACTGSRPVVLYAHGTSVEKAFDMSNLRANSEASLVAATYAAQGYIVVAPNYAGYGTSTLPYHPFLNADQQAKDVIDSLRAARKAFPAIGAAASDKLFLTGYSQGGFVAMAALREIQANHASEFKVTAIGGLSAPYATSYIVDGVFAGAPYFFPFASSSWQTAYGDLYASPADIYESPFYTWIESLMPGDLTLSELYSMGRLPLSKLFDDTLTANAVSPMIASSVRVDSTSAGANSQPVSLSPAIPPPTTGSGNLIRKTFQTSYLADSQANPCSLTNANPLSCTPALPLRKAAVRNDLRNFTPTAPVFMCGGSLDPSVFFASTTKTADFFATKGLPAGAVTVLDLEAPITGASDLFATAKGGFALSKTATGSKATAAGLTAATEVAKAYHGTLVPPFCNVAARGFFQKFLAQ